MIRHTHSVTTPSDTMTKTGKKSTKRTPSSIIGKTGKGKSSNGKGKAKAIVTPTKKKPTTQKKCDHGKANEGLHCAKCFVLGIGGAGIRNPCQHGIADKGCRCVECKILGTGGSGICDHLQRKDRCTEGCKATERCEHGVIKHTCKTPPCFGNQICKEHGKNRSKCDKCNKPGEGHLCPCGKPRSTCKPCGGSDWCKCGVQKTKCTQGCGGSQICPCGKYLYQCTTCEGSQVCPCGKQKHACADCNDRFCLCCEQEKTAAADAMCQTCLSRLHGTSVEEIYLTAIMCCALYGGTDNLGKVSVKKIDESGTAFDMLFDDISDTGTIVVEHDSAWFYDSNESLERDTKKTLRALAEECIIIRHRHVDCPKIELDDDDFHVVEFIGLSSKKHATRLGLALVEYMISMNVLSEACTDFALEFAMTSEEMSELAYDGAISFIRNIVSPWK